jgi:hypothetical protein
LAKNEQLDATRSACDNPPVNPTLNASIRNAPVPT